VLRKLGTIAELALDAILIAFLLVSAARSSRGWLIAAIILAVLIVFGKVVRLTRFLASRSQLDG
jgi:hypothetical protein